MSTTEIIMRPLMPGNAGLESIGSVTANFARQNAEEEFTRFKNESARSSLSDSILSMYGQVAYDEHVAWERETAVRAQREDEERRAFRARLLRRPRKYCRLLRKGWKRALKRDGDSSLVGH